MIKTSEPKEFFAYFGTFRTKDFFDAKNLLSVLVILTITTISSSLNAESNNLNNCLLEAIKNANNEKTIGDIRKECSDHSPQKIENFPWTDSSDAIKSDQDLADNSQDIDESDPIARRIKLEKEVELNPFMLTAHKPNYVLPFAYNFDRNEESFQSVAGDKHLDSTELKFQISLKFPIWRGLYKNYGDIYVAYTNLSFWQAYNSDFSSPFRETNHEPEVFISFKNNWEFLGITNNVINIGAVHQSNGQSGALSRSWNRVYANFVFQKDNFTVSIKPWLRIIEDEDNDDNPDIDKYLGHGELRVGYKWGEHTLSSMFRNNFRSDNKGALELGWSFPIGNRIRGYVQYFYGYGESLIDYNVSTNRLSVGVALTDWM